MKRLLHNFSKREENDFFRTTTIDLTINTFPKVRLYIRSRQPKRTYSKMSQNKGHLSNVSFYNINVTQYFILQTCADRALIQVSFLLFLQVVHKIDRTQSQTICCAAKFFFIINVSFIKVVTVEVDCEIGRYC